MMFKLYVAVFYVLVWVGAWTGTWWTWCMVDLLGLMDLVIW